MLSTTPTPLANPRLLITSHTESGASIFFHDQSLEPFVPFGLSASSFAVFDARPTVPVSNQPDPLYQQDLAQSLPRCPP
ncbi:uncharacterized protein BCR38DRAFT_500723 [Pseudomassariella vexata]|uniref:Uncharacterized protein n=1 Tax=Pseudomassariella vexata TaxID=1141098 RepID=A0A1Y2DFL5_9PEZI|nr:uncharacterized protein BCR38DRAFT_500723 [Pseudomassariella vexata]ORY58061.1 hypothetical protein BCR38DRAFT_500723 [Pseudomassariella vexata]